MRRALIIMGSLALLAPVSVSAQSAPPFQLVRSDETYAYLSDPSLRAKGLNPIRFIPLPGADRAYLSLGGEARLRLDHFDAARFGIGANADTYGLLRTLLHADLHLGERLRVYGEIGDHSTHGKSPPFSPSDRDRLDLQNLFVDVVFDRDERLRLRSGRQELQFNPTQRFVSVREGPNLRQSFDGVRLTWRPRDWRIDAFATRPVDYKPGAFDDASDDRQSFSGLYVSRPFKREGSTLTVDAYLFDLKRRLARYGSISGREARVSLGLRLAAVRGPWDFDGEAIAQTGTFESRDIRAWGYGADAGYTMKGPWSPRLGLRFDGGSGDDNPGDGRLGTFNPMFPKGAYFNEAALDSFANRRSIRASARGRPRSDLVLEISATSRWRQTEADAVYLQPETALAGTAGRAGRWVGQAYALDGVWKATRNLTLTGEVVHQTAGAVIRGAGGSDADFVMLMAQFRF